MTEAPTIGEMYNLAKSSNHLETSTVKRGAVDYLIAAAWAAKQWEREHLGDDMTPARVRWKGLSFKLHQLAWEYDVVRGEVEQAGKYICPLRHYVSPKRDEAKALAMRRFDGKVAEAQAQQVAGLMAEADEDEKMARAQAFKTEADVRRAARAFALVQLKSLEATKQEIFQWACWKATKLQFMESDKVIGHLVGPVIDAWLNPNCSYCNGVGHTGGYGSPQKICRECKGTGRRKGGIGHGAIQNLFAGQLLMEMDSMVGDVDKVMRKYLNQQEA